VASIPPAPTASEAKGYTPSSVRAPLSIGDSISRGRDQEPARRRT